VSTDTNLILKRSIVGPRRSSLLLRSPSRWQKSHPPSEERARERRGVDHPLAYHQPQTCRNASVGGISKCTQRRTMDAESAIEGLRGHADGGGLQGNDRVSDLTRNIRRQILKEPRHDRQIEDALLRTTGSVRCVSHARGLGLFHCHSLCLAGFSICLPGGRTTAADCQPTNIGIPAKPVGMTKMRLFNLLSFLCTVFSYGRPSEKESSPAVTPNE
jgi:hypothetical protein